MQDVRYAFWRAAGAQLIEKEAARLQKKAQETVRFLQTAEALNLEDSSVILQKQSKILESVHEMNRLKTELSFAKTELAALVNLPAGSNYILDTDNFDDVAFLDIPTFTLGADEIESMALVLRPEMREEAYKQRVQQKAMRLAVMETFPGLELISGSNYNSNQFLDDQRWVNFSVSLTQNLVKLFTLPARYKQEKSRQKAGDLRRQALAAAVMTQTRIAMTRYYLSKDQFNLMKRINAVDNKMSARARGKAYAESIAEPDLVLAEIRSLLSLIRTYLAYADLQNAYGRVINTTGLDLLPADIHSANLRDIRQAIEHRLAYQNKIIEDVYWAIYEKSQGALAMQAQPVSDHGSVEGYTSAVYSSSLHGDAKDQNYRVLDDSQQNNIDFIEENRDAQEKSGVRPLGPREAAKTTSPYPKSPIQNDVIPKYPGASQPVLEGDPALDIRRIQTVPQGEEVHVQKQKAVRVRQPIVKASFEGASGPCDTYYQIQNGCLE
jgi:hypothetical protein